MSINRDCMVRAFHEQANDPCNVYKLFQQVAIIKSVSVSCCIYFNRVSRESKRALALAHHPPRELFPSRELKCVHHKAVSTTRYRYAL